MTIIFLLIAILLTLLSLPGTLQLLFLTTAAWLPKRNIPLNKKASATNIAVVIPAHNEETGIVHTLQSLLDCDNPLDVKHIHVVADNCSDNTAKVARQYGVSVFERNDEQLRGKGYALNYAFTKIQDDFDAIIVVDADSAVDKNFIDVFRNLFANGNAAGQATYRVKNANEGIRPRLMNVAFLAFNLLRPLGRENVGLSVGILGNGFGVSTETLKQIPYDSFSIVEDLEYHIRLIKSGAKVRFLMDTTVWSDMPVSSADAQSQRERWEGGRFLMLREQVPQLFTQILKGQFKLIEPLFELLLLPLSFHLLLILILLFIGTAATKIYAILALVVVVFHILSAMKHGKASWQDWKALLSAPFYILWKLSRLDGILKASKKGYTWTRTRR